MADLRKLLPHIVEKSPNYAALIQAQLDNQPNLRFDLILYNDEATGRNLLQADTKKKASLWYFAFKEISWLWCDAVWHPLCVVQHSDFDKIEGNFSAIVRQIVTNLLNQDLHLGVPVVLPSGHYLLRCELRFIISDLDSIRAAMSLKGSSAIRCCCFCRNAIKKIVVWKNSVTISWTFRATTSKLLMIKPMLIFGPLLMNFIASSPS